MSAAPEQARVEAFPATPPPPPRPVRAGFFPPSAGDVYLAEWTGRFTIPSIILADDLRPLWTNGAADAMLAAGRDFHLSNGVFACVDRTQGPALRDFLAGLGDQPAAWIYRRGETCQMLRAEALRAQGLPPARALMIYPIDSEDRFLWSDFHKVFGLTPAETAVVRRLVGGVSADMIAEEMSIALDTVRTHVRRIYAKVGVSNREQLFSRIGPFRIR